MAKRKKRKKEKIYTSSKQCFLLISNYWWFPNWFDSRVVMVSSMKSLMGFFLQGIKLLTHQAQQILFILLMGMAMSWFIMVQVEQLLRLLVRMKTSHLFSQLQDKKMDQDSQLLVRTTITFFPYKSSMDLIAFVIGGYLIYH